MVVAQHVAATARRAAYRTGVDDIGIVGLDRDVSAFGAAYGVVVAQGMAPFHVRLGVLMALLSC